MLSSEEDMEWIQNTSQNREPIISASARPDVYRIMRISMTIAASVWAPAVSAETLRKCTAVVQSAAISKNAALQMEFR